MAKIEKEFRYEGETFTFFGQKGHVKMYVNVSDTCILSTDLSDEILFIIVADCNQNSGYLEITKAE